MAAKKKSAKPKRKHLVIEKVIVIQTVVDGMEYLQSWMTDMSDLKELQRKNR